MSSTMIFGGRRLCSAITSDAGVLPYRELDDAVGLTETGADRLADPRTGKNGRHRLAGLLRQSVFGRLAGYEEGDFSLPEPVNGAILAPKLTESGECRFAPFEAVALEGRLAVRIFRRVVA